MLALSLSLVLSIAQTNELETIRHISAQWQSNYGPPQVIYERYTTCQGFFSEQKDRYAFFYYGKNPPKWYFAWSIEQGKRLNIWSLADDIVRLNLSDDSKIRKFREIKQMIGDSIYTGTLPGYVAEGFPIMPVLPPKQEND